MICCVGVLAAVAASHGAVAQTGPLLVTHVPGQSLHDAIRESKLAARVGALRADWAARTADAAVPQSYALPSITKGSLLTTSLNVTTPLAAPTLSVSFTTDTPGLSYMCYEFSGPGGGQYLESCYDSGQPLTKGTLVLQAPEGGGVFGLYAAPGTWTLSYIYLVDTAGDFQSYQGSALTAIFQPSTFALTNAGTPDTMPPTVTSGKILTPSISLSSATYPKFLAQLGVGDNLSGVASVLVYIEPPGGTFGLAYYSYTPHPLLTGTAVAADYLFSETGGSIPTGIWTVDGFGACDIATNCYEDFNPADIKKLFGKNKFKVTD
jgi:hypothetical protein